MELVRQVRSNVTVGRWSTSVNRQLVLPPGVVRKEEKQWEGRERREKGWMRYRKGPLKSGKGD